MRTALVKIKQKRYLYSAPWIPFSEYNDFLDDGDHVIMLHTYTTMTGKWYYGLTEYGLVWFHREHIEPEAFVMENISFT